MFDFKQIVSSFLTSVLLCLPGLSNGRMVDFYVDKVGVSFVMYNNAIARAYEAYAKYAKTDDLYPNPVEAVAMLFVSRAISMEDVNTEKAKNLVKYFEFNYEKYYKQRGFSSLSGDRADLKKVNIDVFLNDMLTGSLPYPSDGELQRVAIEMAEDLNLYRKAKYIIYMQNESNSYYPGIATAAFLLNNLSGYEDLKIKKKLVWMHQKINVEIFNAVMFNVLVECAPEIKSYYYDNGVTRSNGKPIDYFACIGSESNIDENFFRRFTPASSDGLWKTLTGKRNK